MVPDNERSDDVLSVLSTEDVSPLHAADVTLSKLSSATLNLMVNAVLTETPTAVSSIGY